MSKNMKIIIGTFGFIVLSVFAFCSVLAFSFLEISDEEDGPIEVKQLPQKNPTSYTFNYEGSFEEARQKIFEKTRFPGLDSPFPFKDVDNRGGENYKANANFFICEAKDDICLSSNKEKVREIFKKEENRNDIYLASDGSRIYSSTYYAAGKPLEFRMDFHIHLEAKEDNKVEVTIFPVNPVVYNGYGGIGLHGARLKKEIPVEPTTVEEYQLLRYIGFVLGEKDMPEVNFPK